MGAITRDEDAFYQSLPKGNVNPLWPVVHQLATAKPSPKAVVNLWKYNDIRPLLLEAGDVVTAEEAERRVLMLTNPALSKLINETIQDSLRTHIPQRHHTRRIAYTQACS